MVSFLVICVNKVWMKSDMGGMTDAQNILIEYFNYSNHVSSRGRLTRSNQISCFTLDRN